jgi:hypothetical protein
MCGLRRLEALLVDGNRLVGSIPLCLSSIGTF